MKILTANELLSGATVYLYASGQWDQDIDACRVFSDAEDVELASLTQVAKSTGRLVSVEAEDIQIVGGKVRANRLRERIRAEGPTAPRHALQEILEGDHVSI